MIENLEIDGSTVGCCIYVGNTTDYYEIRNCILFGSPYKEYSDAFTRYYYSSGIYLHNTFNGIVENNTIQDNWGYGIGVKYSNDLIIKNNTLNRNRWLCIYHSNSYNNIIENNSMSSSIQGIYLTFSSNNMIKNNNINCNMSSILFHSSESNFIYSNNMSFGGLGFFNYKGYDFNWLTNVISENNSLNSKPILVYENITDSYISEIAGQIIAVNCSNINIMDMEFTNISYPINLKDCNDCHIFNITASYSRLGGSGLFIQESYSNHIYNNYLLGYGFPLTLEYNSHNNSIYENKIGGDDDAPTGGVGTVYIKGNSTNIYDNVFSEIGYSGISIQSSFSLGEPFLLASLFLHQNRTTWLPHPKVPGLSRVDLRGHPSWGSR